MISIAYTIYYSTYLLLAVIILVKYKSMITVQPLILLLPFGLLVEVLFNITKQSYAIYDFWDVIQWCCISYYLCQKHSQTRSVSTTFGINAVIIGLLLFLRPILDIPEVNIVMLVNLCYISMVLFYLITVIWLKHTTNALSLLFFIMLFFDYSYSGINAALYSFIGKEHIVLDYFMICFLAFKSIINITMGSMVMIVNQYKQHFS